MSLILSYDKILHGYFDTPMIILILQLLKFELPTFCMVESDMYYGSDEEILDFIHTIVLIVFRI